MNKKNNVLASFNIEKPDLRSKDDRYGNILTVEAKYGHWVVKLDVQDVHVRSSISIGVLWGKERRGRVLETLTEGRYIVECKYKPRVGPFVSRFNALYDKYRELSFFDIINNLGFAKTKKTTHYHFEEPFKPKDDAN